MPTRIGSALVPAASGLTFTQRRRSCCRWRVRHRGRGSQGTSRSSASTVPHAGAALRCGAQAAVHPRELPFPPTSARQQLEASGLQCCRTRTTPHNALGCTLLDPGLASAFGGILAPPVVCPGRLPAGSCCSPAAPRSRPKGVSLRQQRPRLRLRLHRGVHVGRSGCRDSSASRRPRVPVSAGAHEHYSVRPDGWLAELLAPGCSIG